MTADAVGGVWTYAVEMASALAEHGVEVTVAVMGSGLTASHRQEARAAGVVELHERDLALEWMDDPWDDVDRAGRWLLRLAEEAGPDLVHLNGYAHASLPWTVPTVAVAHSCVTSWWAAVRGGAPPPAWDEYRRRVGDGLAAADLVVAPTEAFLHELRRWYAFGGARVIPNGRGTAWVVAAPKEPFALGAGRLWDDAKNLGLLDEAARELRWPVVLAGDTTAPHGSSRPPRFAHAVGRLDPPDLARLLARAAVFVHPARYEPFGLGPLEAALSGCALVLGDIPTLREVWGTAATYVDPDDGRGLASVLDGLLADPARAAVLGDQARRRAQTYHPAAMADAYLAAYRSLLSPVGSR